MAAYIVRALKAQTLPNGQEEQMQVASVTVYADDEVEARKQGLAQLGDVAGMTVTVEDSVATAGMARLFQNVGNDSNFQHLGTFEDGRRVD